MNKAREHSVMDFNYFLIKGVRFIETDNNLNQFKWSLKNEKNLCFYNLPAVYGIYFFSTGFFNGYCHFCGKQLRNTNRQGVDLQYALVWTFMGIVCTQPSEQSVPVSFALETPFYIGDLSRIFFGDDFGSSNNPLF